MLATWVKALYSSTKIYRRHQKSSLGEVIKSFLDYYVLLCNTCLYRSVRRHGHHCRSSPLGEVRILRRTATRTHFVVIKQRCWTVLFELWYEVASNLNSFFLSWKQRTAVKVVENALQYIKMYAAGVWAKTAKGYFKTVEEQVILLQSKVWSNL